MKKYNMSAREIVDNLNARIALDKLMGGDTWELQTQLDAV